MKGVILLSLVLLAACAPRAVDVRGLLSRPIIDRSAQPLILVELPSRDVVATLIPRDTLDGVVTWRTAEDQTLSFRDGVLIATRGLGDDLMSADVTGTRTALRGGPQRDYPRLMTYLDGEGQTVFRALLCSMAPAMPTTVESYGLAFETTLQVETCNGIGTQFENRYWLNGNGTPRRTEQWVGPGAGPLFVEWLSR